MKTKAEIVQRLLNEKLIDAAEAVVLLETTVIEVAKTEPIYPGYSECPIAPTALYYNSSETLRPPYTVTYN